VEACDGSCDNCENHTAATKCKKCKAAIDGTTSSYYSAGSLPGACSVGCKTASADAVCPACLTNYFVPTGEGCKACNAKCATCDTDNTDAKCLTCAAKHAVAANGNYKTCTACTGAKTSSANCLACVADAAKCDSAAVGYIIDADEAKSCVDAWNCATCTAIVTHSGAG
jgi:hypothetical protein